MSPLYYKGGKFFDWKTKKTAPVISKRPKARKVQIDPSLTWLKDDAHQDLFKTILTLKNRTEVARFLRDLLTKDELNEFSGRWKAARMLDARAPYLEIENVTGMSSRTIARISNWLKKGAGGYRLAMLNTNHHAHTNTLPGRGLR
jgi:TrpR-related protein YerC/YecD